MGPKAAGSHTQRDWHLLCSLSLGLLRNSSLFVVFVRLQLRFSSSTSFTSLLSQKDASVLVPFCQLITKRVDFPNKAHFHSTPITIRTRRRPCQYFLHQTTLSTSAATSAQGPEQAQQCQLEYTFEKEPNHNHWWFCWGTDSASDVDLESDCGHSEDERSEVDD